MEKHEPQTQGIILRPKLLVPDKAMPKKEEPKVIVVRGTIDPPKKT